MKNVWNETLDLLRKDSSYGAMFHMMERFNDDVAAEMTDKNGNEIKRTYREYITMSKAACGALQSMGIKDEGKFIGLYYDTCMDWPVLLWGILMSGNIPLLLNPMIDDSANVRLLAEARAESYVAAKPLPGCDKKFIDAAELLKSGLPQGEEKWGKYVALCTSGTTGKSRIFLYDSQTIANHMLSFDEAKHNNPDMPFIEDKPCKLLAFLPFHHVFGFSVVYLLYACTGKTLVYLKDKSVNTILSTCQKHGVTHLYCVPVFFNALADGIVKKLGGKDIHKLNFIVKDLIKRNTLGTKIRSMITGGGHVPESTLDILNSVGYPLCNGFGMTETGIIAVEQSLDAKQRIKGSIGIPFTLTEWKIDSPDGTEGELHIRGGALYSASMIDGQIVPRDTSAWFATGDIVKKTPDGLYITGRCKDVILGANGENIYPEELEDAYGTVDGLGSFCILGLSRDGMYDDIVLVTKIDPLADRVQILDKIRAANEKLAAVSRPTRVYFSKDDLPVSGSLKIKRQIIKKEIENGTWICEKFDLYKKSEVDDYANGGLTGDAAADSFDISEGDEASTADAATGINHKAANAQSANAQAANAQSADADYKSTPEFKNILDEVKNCIISEIGIEAEKIGNDDHFINVLGADSLDMYNVFMGLSEKYKIEIDEEDMMKLENCDKTADYIYRLLRKMD